MYYLPSFYVRDEVGFTDMGHEKGWLLIFTIWGLEHFMIVVGLAIFYIVPSIPEELLDKLERRHFLLSREDENRLHGKLHKDKKNS